MSRIKVRWNSLVEDFWNADTRPSIAALCFGSIGWAILLGWGGDTFNREVYKAMAAWFPEEIWTALFASHGIFLFYRLIAENRLPPWLLMTFNIAGCVLWTSSHLLMSLLYPLPAAIAPGYVLGLMSWWVLIRTGTGAREDMRAKR
jgi:hypothetical protein